MDFDVTQFITETTHGILDQSTFRVSKEDKKELKHVVDRFLLEKAFSQAQSIWQNRNLLGLDYETRVARQ